MDFRPYISFREISHMISRPPDKIFYIINNNFILRMNNVKDNLYMAYFQSYLLRKISKSLF
jgi:hypothetical protein